MKQTYQDVFFNIRCDCWRLIKCVGIWDRRFFERGKLSEKEKRRTLDFNDCQKSGEWEHSSSTSEE